MLCEKQYSNLLLGKFLSDPIEKEFDKFRHGFGGTYYITAKCVFEKIRIQKGKLFLKLNDRNCLNEYDSQHVCENCTFSPAGELWENLIDITHSEDIENIVSKDSLMTLV